MISFGAWNVRGINKTRKQLKVARFISYHNLSLVSLLETKVRRKGLRAHYLRMFPNWCLTTNLAWHDGGRIIVGWKSGDVHVDILCCLSQFIHLLLLLLMVPRLYVPLCMVQMTSGNDIICFVSSDV